MVNIENHKVIMIVTRIHCYSLKLHWWYEKIFDWFKIDFESLLLFFLVQKFVILRYISSIVHFELMVLCIIMYVAVSCNLLLISLFFTAYRVPKGVWLTCYFDFISKYTAVQCSMCSVLPFLYYFCLFNLLQLWNFKT